MEPMVPCSSCTGALCDLEVMEASIKKQWRCGSCHISFELTREIGTETPVFLELYGEENPR